VVAAPLGDHTSEVTFKYLGAYASLYRAEASGDVAEAVSEAFCEAVSEEGDVILGGVRERAV
jgi:hypothetical protein